MGVLTNKFPKCLTEISPNQTILGRQLHQLCDCNITDIVITTGLFEKVLVDYCNSLNLPAQITFINNPLYSETNYIYSIYLARKCLDDDIVMMHGDLIFEPGILQDMLNQNGSCMTVSSTISLPLKDFKAVIKNRLIEKVGVEFFDNAVTAQPLYKINKTDWNIWLNRIISYCEGGQVSCYAEKAFNEVSNTCRIYPMDYADRLCAEIDTPEDLAVIKEKLVRFEHQQCFTVRGGE